MATAKDIAQLSGVSLSAVSIALNGKPGISDETRKRILDTAQKLGYTKRSWNEQKKSKPAIPDLRQQRRGRFLLRKHFLFQCHRRCLPAGAVFGISAVAGLCL